MKLLSENITENGNPRSYSKYIGYFEHTRESGEVMLISISFNTDRGLDINLFIKEQGFVKIAGFDSIPFLEPIPHNKCHGDEFAKMIKYNNGSIEEWLNTVFY